MQRSHVVIAAAAAGVLALGAAGMARRSDRWQQPARPQQQEAQPPNVIVYKSPT